MEGREEKLRRLVLAELERSMGREGSKLSRERLALKKRYLGHGYAVDEDRAARGFSVYVDRTVMETVEWAKPGLMRIFCGDEIIRFDPRTPDQEQAAEDATQYVNQVVFARNMFRLVHDVLTDGLYQRVGWCLVHCPRQERRQVMQYAGLSRQEAEALLEDPSLEPPEEDTAAVRQYVTPEGVLYDLTLHRTVTTREIRIDPVASEQVVLSADAEDVEHARFVAYWSLRTASDLRREGYSAALIDELPVLDGDGEMPETGAGRAVNAEEPGDVAETDEAARRFRIYEAWLDADLDGDGIAEKLKVVFAGDDERCRILRWEEWPLYRPPLFAACSVPLPHRAVGLCLADLVSDLQDLRTELTRQYLDNLALANQGELVVNEGQSGAVEYDSLLARGVGAVHRIRGDAQITPLPVSSASGEALAGLEMSGELVERRTGVSSRTRSLAADTLQNTATGAVIMEEAINQRLELVARVYAETFFRPLGRYVLHLLHRYGKGLVRGRLKGRFQSFDPATWDPDMDISVAVGLGTGNRQRLLTTYQGILGIQQQFFRELGQNSPVHLSHLVHTCHRMVEAAGLEAPERFFGTEEQAARAEQAAMQTPAQPSPQEKKMQLEQEKAGAKQRTEDWKAQTEARRKAYETQSRLELERQKTEGELALKVMELQLEKQLDETRSVPPGAGRHERGGA